MTGIIKWKNAPMIRLVIPFLIGVIPGIYLQVSSPLWLYIFLGSSLISLLTLLSSKKNPSLNKEIFFGTISSITLVFFGLALVVSKTSKNRSDFYSNVTSEPTSYVLEVTDLPKNKPNSIQVIGTITSVTDSSKTFSSSGEVLLYFEKSENSETILQGDQLILSTNLNDISSPQNPGQFNYKQYLYFNQIYQQGYVKKGDWKKLKSSGFGIIQFAAGIRDQLLITLKENGIEGDQLAVASALILGYKEDLGSDLKHSYSSAGATHVLAVSGLHVGIIYLVLNFFLSLFDKNDKFKFVRLVATLVFLWFYALLTGLSPSVVRAATMFSFVAVGKTFDRKSSIYNTLAASAFVLLVINPFLIMEVGFQLSYLAVIGIVYFQKIIYNKIYISNKFGDYLWKITSVSIAAQLTTFPLGLLYFHQFPTYFFISNLIVIPGAMIIIGIGLLLFCTSIIPILGAAVGALLNTVIWGMNWVVFQIDSLPFSLLEGISISILECWLLYIGIMLFALGYETRKLKYVLGTLLCLFTIFVYDIVEDSKIRNHKELVIYSIKNNTNLNLIDSEKNYFIANKTLIEDQNTLLFNVKHHWYDLDHIEATGIELNSDYSNSSILKQNHYIHFHDKSICILDSTPSIYDEKLSIDVLYINSKEYFEIDIIQKQYTFNHLILGNDCHWKFIKMLNEVKELKEHLHNIKTEGAFVLSFDKK